MSGRRLDWLVRAFPADWRVEYEEDLRETVSADLDANQRQLGFRYAGELVGAGLRVRMRRGGFGGLLIVGLVAAVVAAAIGVAFVVSPSSQRLVVFLSAAVVLAVLPGPGLFYVFARTLRGGRREGLESSLGAGLGGLAHVFAATVGLSTLLASSAFAFNVVRFVGAGYLVLMGLQTFFAANEDLQLDSAARGGSASSPIRQGFVVEALNPKTSLFFLSFLPQFVEPGAAVAQQFIVLGTLVVILNTSADVVLAVFASPLSQRLALRPGLLRRQRQTSGVALIGLGGFVALSGVEAKP